MTISMKGLLLVAAIAGLPAIAGAHVVLDTPQAPAGSYYKAIFNVPHGCDGSPTIQLRILLPEEIIIAKPMPKTGWSIQIVKEALQQPVRNEGREIVQRVKEVIWRGGPLSADEFDSFTMLIKLPETAGRLYLPAVQSCEAGAWDWVDIPPQGQTSRDVRSPAPSVLVLPASGSR